MQFTSPADVPASALRIQVVAFDWPWPPDYGGVIDIAYRLQALLEAGVHVVLHVVAAGGREDSLPPSWPTQNLVVFRYTRLGKRSAISRRPYIVRSRQVEKLLPNLASGAPVILFEGIHTTGYLGHPRLASHTQWLRLHNLEAEYYQTLANTTSHSWKRIYYRVEANRLARYEPRVLEQADLILPITDRDDAAKLDLPPARVQIHPPYTEWSSRSPQEGQGDYYLYHGALDVEDNMRAAEFFVRCFAERPQLRLVIAGRQAPRSLAELIDSHTNIELQKDPSKTAMESLIQGAQAVLISSTNRAGFKLKLLQSLALARHVIADENSTFGAHGLAEAARRLACLTIVDSLADFPKAILDVAERGLSKDEASRRAEILEPYAPHHLVQILVEKLKIETFNRN